MGAQQSRAHLIALDPVFNASDAETILRSCDGVDFAVHNVILQLISPYFMDMLPSSSESLPSRPVVEMIEDSSSLRLLLEFSYPRSVCEEPDLLDISEIKRAAVLARRYNIAFLRNKVEHALLRYSSVSAASAFAISWKFGYQDALRAAARRSLDVNDFFKSVADSDDILEFNDIPATAVFHLYRYHASVRPQLENILQRNSRDYPVTWIKPSLVKASPACTCSVEAVWFRQPDTERASEWRVYLWWWEYVHAVITSVQCRRRPSIEDALDEPMLRCMRMASRCSSCDDGVVVAHVLHVTRQALHREIEELLSTIPLQL